ncbi:hypothetical protein, partial [Streptomyces clavuligerus]|uniref:hypothetical protein n=1 Tax=Streptomyces clavuligerus TaxID=1901 RepID=UPI001E642049
MTLLQDTRTAAEPARYPAPLATGRRRRHAAAHGLPADPHPGPGSLRAGEEVGCAFGEAAGV